MALYPTPAGHRMAYDRDGATGFWISPGGVVTQFITSDMQAMNDESDSTFVLDWVDSTGTITWGLLFPEQRDILSYYLKFRNAGFSGFTVGPMEWSNNTTAGNDGTWTTVTGESSFTPDFGNTQPDYRTTIHSLASTLTSVKAIRFTLSAGGIVNEQHVYTMHVYGQPSTGANPDSLRVWQPVVDAEVTTVFDYGDVARGTTTTKTFRIKNLSATKTATSIAISAEALTDASPTLIPQFTFSTDNVTFATSINIGTLAPGATSGVLYVRDTVASSAALSVWALRMVAVPATFA